MCSQPGEKGGPYGALHWQYRVQDRCGHCEAGGHGKGQAEEERGPEQTAGWGHGGEGFTIKTTESVLKDTGQVHHS